MKSIKLVSIVSAAFVATAVSQPAISQDGSTLPVRVTDFAKTEAANDHAIGSEDAAITMIIWASVTCPHCGEWFSNEWPNVKKELVQTGKLRVIFRPFPTAPAELSMTGFRLAECAPTEDYMSIIEYQMENQDYIFKAASEGRGKEIYTEIAKLAGMETEEAIATCFRNPDITANIIDNADRAQVAEVKGVPAFLINGETYLGKQDSGSLIALINEMDEKGLTAIPQDIEPANTAEEHDHD